MTDDDRCPITELRRGECAHCRPPVELPDDDPDAYGPAVPAAFPGVCVEEGDRIDVDDMIRAHPDGGWAHEGCVE